MVSGLIDAVPVRDNINHASHGTTKGLFV
jgi:hypothetical protein